MIEGLSHITFIVKDLDASTHLLKTVFDAEETYASGDRQFSLSEERFFTIGDLWIVLMKGEPVEKTYNHVAFKIYEEYLGMYENRIRTLGLEIKPGRPREKEKGKSLYFYDYDGHLFELHTGTLQTRMSLYAQ